MINGRDERSFSKGNVSPLTHSTQVSVQKDKKGIRNTARVGIEFYLWKKLKAEG